MSPFRNMENHNPLTHFLTLARQWHVLGPRDHAAGVFMKSARSNDDVRSSTVMTVGAHKVHGLKMYPGRRRPDPVTWNDFPPRPVTS